MQSQGLPLGHSTNFKAVHQSAVHRPRQAARTKPCSGRPDSPAAQPPQKGIWSLAGHIRLWHRRPAAGLRLSAGSREAPGACLHRAAAQYDSLSRPASPAALHSPMPVVTNRDTTRMAHLAWRRGRRAGGGSWWVTGEGKAGCAGQSMCRRPRSDSNSPAGGRTQLSPSLIAVADAALQPLLCLKVSLPVRRQGRR